MFSFSSTFFHFFFFFFFFLCFPHLSSCKSTIESCPGSSFCKAMVGYTLYTEMKVAEVAGLFQVQWTDLLLSNSIDIYASGVQNHILPMGLFLMIPVNCSCNDGIRQSISTYYKTRPSDSLSYIASTVFSSLISVEQIGVANNLSDDSISIGQSLLIPLPCICHNMMDNSLPAIFLSYVVNAKDSISGIANRFFTTVNDIMDVNDMGSSEVTAGDIIAISLPACTSDFPRYAVDHGLMLANGSYTLTAGNCVQCSCAPGNLILSCTPSSLAVSCSSMQCSGSELMIGNVTVENTSAGCNVTSCRYRGYFGKTILTTLSTTLQPHCPSPIESPLLTSPPDAVPNPYFSPSPAPSPNSGGNRPIPRTSPGSIILPGIAPKSGIPGSTSDGLPSLNPSYCFMNVLFLFLSVRLLL